MYVLKKQAGTLSLTYESNGQTRRPFDFCSQDEK